MANMHPVQVRLNNVAGSWGLDESDASKNNKYGEYVQLGVDQCRRI